jgi:hypothetical protein
MDPITASLLAGAVGEAAGGAAGKAVEAVVEIANKTLHSRFAEQREAAQKEAVANGQDLVNKIEEGFRRTEAYNAAMQRQIDRVLGSPSYGVLLQETLFRGMQTANEEKHILLARLVIQRLQSESESVLAFASDMACRAIAGATAPELRILALRSTIDRLIPSSPAHLAYSENSKMTELEWVTRLLAPYSTLHYSDLDFLQLHALGCLRGRTGMLAPDLETEITGRGCLTFELSQFMATDVGAHVTRLWREHQLVFADLNSVGLLVGIYVSDALHGTVSDLSAWGT